MDFSGLQPILDRISQVAQRFGSFGQSQPPGQNIPSVFNTGSFSPPPPPSIPSVFNIKPPSINWGNVGQQIQQAPQNYINTMQPKWQQMSSDSFWHPQPFTTAVKPEVFNTPVLGGVARLGASIGDMFSQAAYNPLYDTGRNFANVVQNKPLTNYQDLTSGAVKLAYHDINDQTGQQLTPGTPNTWQSRLGAVGETASPILAFYGGEGLVGSAKGAFGNTAATTLGQKVTTGALRGGAGIGTVSFLQGLNDNQKETLANQLIKSGQAAAAGAVIGAIIGGGTPVIAEGAGKLVNLTKDSFNNPHVMAVLQDQTGGIRLGANVSLKKTKQQASQASASDIAAALKSGSITKEEAQLLGQQAIQAVAQPSPADIAKALKSGNITPEEAQRLAGNTRQILNGATTKERGFITHIKLAANTPEPLKKMVAGTYVPKSNRQLVADAKALIRTNPQAAEQMAMNPTSDVHVQVGNELVNYYANKGDTVRASQVANEMAKSGTEFGRAVQAFSQYDKTTPSGSIQYAQQKVNEYNRLNPNKRLKITNAQIEDIFNQARKVQAMPEGQARNIAANKLMNRVNDLIPSSIVDKGITIWKAGLLTSPVTHIRNLVGNTTHGTAEIVKDIPGSLADRLMATRTGQRSITFTTSGLGSGGKTGYQAAKDIMKYGYDPEKAVANYDIQHVTWDKTPVQQFFRRYTNLVFRSLNAADQPFYNAAYARSLYDQAGAQAINAGKQGNKAYINRLVSKPSNEMVKIALTDANVATFHNKTLLGSYAVALKRAAAQAAGVDQGLSKIATEVSMPFTGVPSSIAGQMVAYSPIGLTKGSIDVGRVMAGQVPQLQRQAAQELGRGVVGTAILGLAGYLASKGLMTGQPKDDAEKAQWKLENKQPNSILIGGKWRSINSIGPEYLIALAGAKAQQEFSPNGEKDWAHLLSSIGKDFTDQPFLQGMSAPINALSNPTGKGKAFIGNLISSPIPNLVKVTARAFDTWARENNNVGDYFRNALPGFRNQGLVQRDNLGNPIAQEPTGLNAYFDLLNSKTPISNPVVDELSRLNSVGFNAAPGEITKNQTIKGVKMSLTKEQIDVLESAIGPQAMETLNQLFSSPNYQALQDQQKQEAVDSIMKQIRTRVRGTIDINAPANPPSSSQFPAGSLVSQQNFQSGNVPTGAGQPTGVGSRYILINPDTGAVKQVDLTKPILLPKQTGSAEIDKLAVSKFKSAVTNRINDIYALYQDNQLSLDQANTLIAQLKSSSAGIGSGIRIPKPRKPSMRISRGSVRRVSAKIAPLKIRKVKLAQIKFSVPKENKTKIAKIKIRPIKA